MYTGYAVRIKGKTVNKFTKKDHDGDWMRCLQAAASHRAILLKEAQASSKTPSKAEALSIIPAKAEAAATSISPGIASTVGSSSSSTDTWIPPPPWPPPIHPPTPPGIDEMPAGLVWDENRKLVEATIVLQGATELVRSFPWTPETSKQIVRLASFWMLAVIKKREATPKASLEELSEAAKELAEAECALSENPEMKCLLSNATAEGNDEVEDCALEMLNPIMNETQLLETGGGTTLEIPELYGTSLGV